MLATSFSNLRWMLSGPADLLGSRFESHFSMVALSTIILVIWLVVLDRGTGGSWPSGLDVKTDVNCWFRSSAISPRLITSLLPSLDIHLMLWQL